MRVYSLNGMGRCVDYFSLGVASVHWRYDLDLGLMCDIGYRAGVLG